MNRTLSAIAPAGASPRLSVRALHTAGVIELDACAPFVVRRGRLRSSEWVHTVAVSFRGGRTTWGLCVQNRTAPGRQRRAYVVAFEGLERLRTEPYDPAWWALMREAPPWVIRRATEYVGLSVNSRTVARLGR